MAYLARGIKDDLKILADDLGIQVQPDFKIIDLKNAILKSKDYDEEFCKERLNTIMNTRKEEIEEQKRKEQMQFELERMKSETELLRSRQTRVDDSETRNPSKEFRNFMQKYDMKEDINLYLILFERQARRVSLPEEEWVTHLLALLPNEINQLIAREPEDKVDKYEYVKELLLRRFKLTPEKFRQLFTSHEKAQASTWRDFYHELFTYFEGWTSALKITTFEQLRDLIVCDQIKKRVPVDFREFYLDEWSNIISPTQLIEKLDDFESVKTPTKVPSNTERDRTKPVKPFFHNPPERFYRNREISSRDIRKGLSGNRPIEEIEKRALLQCYECGESGHYKFRCPKLKKKNDGSFAENEKRTSDAHMTRTPNEVKKSIQTKNVTFCGFTVAALIDTGSSVSILREDVYKRIAGLPRLSQKPLLLSGLGFSEVSTNGCFEQEVEIDGCSFLLTWHVVPTAKLSYQAVIGIDILDQASLNFSKNGIEFCKHEADAWFMQIPEDDSVIDSKNQHYEKIDAPACDRKDYAKSHNRYFENPQAERINGPAGDRKDYIKGRNRNFDYRGNNKNFNRPNESRANNKYGERYNKQSYAERYNRQSYGERYNRQLFSERYNRQSFNHGNYNKSGYRKHNSKNSYQDESRNLRNFETKDNATKTKEDSIYNSSDMIECEEVSEASDYPPGNSKHKYNNSDFPPRYKNRRFHEGRNNYNNDCGRRSDKPSYNEQKNSHISHRYSLQRAEDSSGKFEKEYENNYQGDNNYKSNYRYDNYKHDNVYNAKQRYPDNKNSFQRNCKGAYNGREDYSNSYNSKG